ncbi:hypothetical protein CC80DRAFT_534052 [Byssothecium circinans]|uniref:protein-tyrosine-phosphatase n=1 Tax=Byssothecium circinans TaxID=147558 RepID=A0A6A5U5J4_9PLEO|nr:hypothetical protein CC80DRAFT_534052 [Byssothecium circinans]
MAGACTNTQRIREFPEDESQQTPSPWRTLLFIEQEKKGRWKEALEEQPVCVTGLLHASVLKPKSSDDEYALSQVSTFTPPTTGGPSGLAFHNQCRCVGQFSLAEAEAGGDDACAQWLRRKMAISMRARSCKFRVNYAVQTKHWRAHIIGRPGQSSSSSSSSNRSHNSTTIHGSRRMMLGAHSEYKRAASSANLPVPSLPFLLVLGACDRPASSPAPPPSRSHLPPTLPGDRAPGRSSLLTRTPSAVRTHAIALSFSPARLPCAPTASRLPANSHTGSAQTGREFTCASRIWYSRFSRMQTGPRSFAPMPSFGAVFGDKAHNSHPKTQSDPDKTSAHGSIAHPVSSGNAHAGVPFSSFHLHRDSRDSTSTASSDNSPTTTISTMDSSTVTDPSPGPSPESPVARVNSSFVADFRSRRTDIGSQDSSPNTFFELARPTTPARKPRNLKNLGINTSSSLGNLRSTQNATTLVIEKKEKNTSAPASPSFIKPPTPPKRRPSNLSLTISTPGSNENKPMRLIIPSTPAGSRPTLRHFQSSPSLPLCSPSTGPSGGMHLPILKTVQTKPSGLFEVPYEMEEEEDQEPNFDIPQSREEKPAAYPNGPIEIYPSGIFLYCEPTLEQACNFDVIINVASEVKNPFTTPASQLEKDINARRVDGPAAENPDFAALSKRASGADSSPPTPKATPVMQVMPAGEREINGKMYKTPEYIHMPWEHNTDIVADLHKLVRTMDERVKEGKRILVHCQCGVSRSASLIVAYGIFKNTQGSVQDTYDVVKKRSKWIGPNMSLIMQLQEYRNTLGKPNDNRSYLNQPFGRRSAGLPTGVSTTSNRHSPFERGVSSAPRTPRTAPLPPDLDMNSQRASTGNLIMLSPGPLSAPSGSSLFSPGFRQSWAASDTHFDLSPKSSPKATPYVDPAGHVIPVLSISNNDVSEQVVPAVEEGSTQREDGLKALPAPNFSRQLPFRSYDDNTAPERPRTSPNPSVLHAPVQPLSFGALRSPAVPSFNIPSFAPDDDDTGLMSPTKTSFNLSPWPPSRDHSSSASSPTTDDMHPPPPPLIPRSSESHMAGLRHDNVEQSFGMFSPRASTLNLDSPSLGMHSFPRDREDSQDFEVTSPVRTEFPSDIFGRASDTEESITSPRASEFHMTPLKPKVEDEDPFGLTSPTRFEFPSDLHKRLSGLTPPRLAQPDLRRPSFQAIPPPSHLAQPEMSNGFVSLNGTAQATSTVPPVVIEPAKPINLDGRMDSLGAASTQLAVPSVGGPVSKLDTTVQEAPITPSKPVQLTLSTPTPPQQPGLRTRFSSPNIREQRRLHKLQTEMEAVLSHQTTKPAQAVDDLDALMSPRAEEFTRNPFHFELPASSTYDNSPASSNETIKDGQARTEWTEKRQWTPQKSLDEDPRSPVQTGSSPIVRNIWDVL